MAKADPGSVHLIVSPTHVRMVLSGEVDADLATDLAEATDEAVATRLPVEVDAHHITFMDSSGVAFLAKLAARMPGRVRVLRAPPTVKFLLEVTRIGELVDIVDEPLTAAIPMVPSNNTVGRDSGRDQLIPVVTS